VFYEILHNMNCILESMFSCKKALKSLPEKNTGRYDFIPYRLGLWRYGLEACAAGRDRIPCPIEIPGGTTDYDTAWVSGGTAWNMLEAQFGPKRHNSLPD
jgi:hypothetical protein